MKIQLLPMSKNETTCGLIFIFVQLLVIPVIVATINDILGNSMTIAAQNFMCFTVNFLCVTIIFRQFWVASVKQLSGRVFHLLKHVFINFLLYYLATILVNLLILSLMPDYYNANDSVIINMANEHYGLIVIGTVILVPPVEEILYRGVIFGKVRQYNQAFAYLVSVAAFSAIHIIPYIGKISEIQLLLSFCQYLPAAFFLARAYEKSGSIFTPILMHAIINLIGVSSV